MIKNWEKLRDALKALIQEISLETFYYEKKKVCN